MKSVSVSELKARLSQHLRDVRRGNEIQIVDRGVPIARISPLSSRDVPAGDHRQRLIEAGILRPGTGDASAILDTPPLQLSTSILDALNEDREDRF
jgi:prevent-host-death family protein